MNIFFKLGNVGWYCVTKGRIFFRAVLFLFVKDVSLSENLTSERCFSTVAFLSIMFLSRESSLSGRRSPYDRLPFGLSILIVASSNLNSSKKVSSATEG